MSLILLLVAGFICFSPAFSRDLELHHGHHGHHRHLHKHHGQGYRGLPYELPGVYQYANQIMVTEITVGNPRKTFKAIVDTGSKLFWIKSSLFNSTSFQPVSYSQCNAESYFEVGNTLCSDDDRSQCFYIQQYQQGTITGYLGNDTISLKTLKKKSVSFPVVMGKTISSRGWDNIDAVLGLGRAPVSLVSQLGDAIDHKFSYCIVDSKHSSLNITTPLVFGGVEELRVGVKDVQSIQMLQDIPGHPEYDLFYKVNLSSVRIGDQVFKTRYPVALLDSGSSVSQFSSDLHDRIRAYYDEHVKLPVFLNFYTLVEFQLDLCYNMTGHEDYQFPSMEIGFEGGSSFVVEAENFLARIDFVSESGLIPVACVGLQSFGGEVSILGNNVQRNHHIMFDTNSSIISYKPTECHKLIY